MSFNVVIVTLVAIDRGVLNKVGECRFVELEIELLVLPGRLHRTQQDERAQTHAGDVELDRSVLETNVFPNGGASKRTDVNYKECCALTSIASVNTDAFCAGAAWVRIAVVETIFEHDALKAAHGVSKLHVMTFGAQQTDRIGVDTALYIQDGG